MGEDEIFCGCGYMWNKEDNDVCPMCGCYEGQLCETRGNKEMNAPVWVLGKHLMYNTREMLPNQEYKADWDGENWILIKRDKVVEFYKKNKERK